jgi:hypothetical protein
LTQLVDIIYRWKACSVHYTAVVAILHSSLIERATKQGVNAFKNNNRSIFQRGKTLIKSICQGHVMYHSIACFFVYRATEARIHKLQAQSLGRRRSLSVQCASSAWHSTLRDDYIMMSSVQHSTLKG